MKEYNCKDIEIKWQKYWEKNHNHEPDLNNIRNKFYSLTMFSYPSGDRLHIGHWYNYGPADTFSRYKKMKGYNVFQPQGFDAFGLPAENYAIRHGVHPAKSTRDNIKRMRDQLKRIGAMYDWRNEINTSSPEYYKWTQWLFLKLHEKGLAYQKVSPVNWCKSCKTVLANEQVKEGACERCHTETTKKSLKQWFFRITKYADELLKELDNLKWPEKTKHMQRNWIGKSIGSNIFFHLVDSDETIEVFTTRADTIFGATYIVLAPEHPLVRKIVTAEQSDDISDYIENAKKISDIERLAANRDKTGVFTGAYAVNPFTNNKIPVWVGDYVLISYGTGAIMAVPGGDERDFEFAGKFNLPVVEVISPDGHLHGNDHCNTEYGILVNSGEFSGMESKKAINAINEILVKRKQGGPKVQYKLHDWLISRQRYWGAPIPVIHCEICGAVPVPVEQLPVVLPDNIKLSKTYGDDLSPLATHDEFLKTDCPECGRTGRRDADTMDTFVCSSWYFLRYPNAKYTDGPFDPGKLGWLPVDQYIGGAEHATMHLLYARFITKVLRDCGYLSFGEPFIRLFHQGTITRDGAKMSKSRGNTVSPDEYVEKYGSDVFRAYLMFMGPFEDGGDWTDSGITGIERFLARSWKMIQYTTNDNISLDRSDSYVVHSTIKAVSSDLERMKFNTAISRLMEYVNHFYGKDSISLEVRDTFIKLLAPFMPHAAEEMWELSGHTPSVFDESWPEYDEKKTVVSTVDIAIQVNGKIRGSINVDVEMGRDEVLSLARQVNNVQKFINDKTIIKEIFVPGRLVSFVVK